MTYDKGAGYVFGNAYDGITVMAPDPKQIGTNRMDIVTNGRKLSRELMDGVKANGEITLCYEYLKPGQEKPIRKVAYAVAVPGWNMYVGTGAYLDDLDAKMAPIAWVLGLAILGIGVDRRQHRLADRPQHRPAARLSRRPHAALADGSLDGEIPGVGRGDEIGAMAETVQIFKDNAVRIRGLEKVEAETRPRRGGAPRGDGKPRQRFRAQRQWHRPLGVDGRGGHADHRAVDDRDGERRQRARGDRRRGVARARRTMSARWLPPPRNCRARWRRFPARSRRSSEIASKAVGDAERTNDTVRRCPAAPRRSARWCN